MVLVLPIDSCASRASEAQVKRCFSMHWVILREKKDSRLLTSPRMPVFAIELEADNEMFVLSQCRFPHQF